jgi:predicted metal-dependent hydrolase
MRIIGLFSIFLISGCATTSSETTCYDRSFWQGGLKSGDCPSSIVSEFVDVDVDVQLDGAKKSVYAGVMYALPRQDLKLTIKREAVTKATLKTKVEKAKKALDDAKEKTKTSQAASDLIDQQIQFGEAQSTADAVLAPLRLKHQVALLDLAVMKNAQLAAQAKFDKADTDSKNHQKDHVKDAFTISGESPVPSDQRFVAQIRKSHLGSETIDLKTTPAGLLSGGTGELKGQADEILIALAKAIGARQGQSYELESVTKQVQPLRQNKSDCTSEPQVFTYVFDPFAPEEYGGSANSQPLVKLNKEMKERKFCYELHAQVPNKAIPDDLKKNQKYNGLLYPRATTVSFDLKSSDSRAGTYSKQNTLTTTVIGGDSYGLISLDRSLFADNEFDFEFKNGLLTRYKSVTPSEILAGLGMVPEVLKALIQVPAELIQLKVDYSSKEAAYYQAEQAIIEARRSYENVRDDDPKSAASEPADSL